MRPEGGKLPAKPFRAQAFFKLRVNVLQVWRKLGGGSAEVSSICQIGEQRRATVTGQFRRR